MIVHVIMASLGQIFKVIKKKYHNKDNKLVRRNNLFWSIKEEYCGILNIMEEFGNLVF